MGANAASRAVFAHPRPFPPLFPAPASAETVVLKHAAIAPRVRAPPPRPDRPFFFFCSFHSPSPHHTLPQTRLAKYYIPLDDADKRTLEYDVHRATAGRDPGFAAVADYKGAKLIFRRYAGLYFTLGADAADNELVLMEAIHLFVEVREWKRGGFGKAVFFFRVLCFFFSHPLFPLQILDHYFGNVCELDLVFNFHKVSDKENGGRGGKRARESYLKKNQSPPFF